MKTAGNQARMKAVCLAVVLLMVYVSHGEALRCKRCIPSVPGRGCRTTVETCRNLDDVCASVLFKPPLPISYFKRCMKTSDSILLGAIQSVDVRTCSFDLCN